MQLISNHPVALPYAHLATYIFLTNCNINCLLELSTVHHLSVCTCAFTLHLMRFGDQETSPAALTAPRDCVLSQITCARVCTCATSVDSLLLFIAQNLDKLCGCHGDRSSRTAGSVAFFFFAADTERVRLHMKNYCVPGCLMFKATSPLLFHSAISVAQLSRISWRCHKGSEERRGG